MSGCTEFTFRKSRAQKHIKQNNIPVPNPDIDLIPDYLAAFTKGLPHNADGIVDPAAFRLLMKAIRKQDLALLQTVPLGGTVKLVCPSSTFEPSFYGVTPGHVTVAAPPRYQSDELAAYMAEVYAMALSRDVNFLDWSTDPIIANMVTRLSAFPEFASVTPSTIFRSDNPGVLVGPYISQFLYRDVNFGLKNIDQQYPMLTPGLDFGITYADCLALQNGQVVGANTFSPVRYVSTLRDLASVVMKEEPDIFVRNTYCTLSNVLKYPANPQLPTSVVEGFFVTEAGKVDAGAMIAESTYLAVNGVWHTKWGNYYLRPEALGLNVERARITGQNVTGISTQLFSNGILSDVALATGGTYLMPLAYAAGSPTHPSFESGHAAILGAGITVLKFLFDGTHTIPLYQPDATGTVLVDTGLTSTVNGELNKLATNVAFGRNAAGIHYRFDAHQGIHAGEQVALGYLREHVKKYIYPVTVSITLYDGETAVITNQ